MPRTTATEVKLIIDTDLSDRIVNAFIAGATELVTEILGSNTTISDDLKNEIERWLTAHMIASTREQQLVEAEAGSTKVKFQGKYGMKLQSTGYGQNVLMLDPTGNFAALGGKAVRTTAIESFE